MLSNFIGGGQIFLHKIRMLRQVLSGSFTIAIIVAIIISCMNYYSSLVRLDIDAIVSFRKAVLADASSDILGLFRKNSNLTIDVKTKKGIYARGISPEKVLNISVFRQEDQKLKEILSDMFLLFLTVIIIGFVLIFWVWSKFGNFIKSEKKIKGGEILTYKKVSTILNRLNFASHIKIGNMPLVKDSETKHFLVCGSTGSGKTNLIHNILCQVIEQRKPAMVIDTTGEMIAKYYNPSRGDIIFNPLDARGKNWDFWKDCCFTGSSNSYDDVPDRLKKFSGILFHFKRRSGANNSDPFWDLAAEKLFNSIVMTLARSSNPSYKELHYMTNSADIKELRSLLVNEPAMRYLSDDGKGVASSVAAVLATSSAPLSYFRDDGESFSLVEYFNSIANGNDAWIFFASPVHQRDLLLPLIACLTELAISMFMEHGSDKARRFWIVIDELAALGNLPAIDTLTSEGRKYGACVIAGLQSINQIYKNYGQYAGSTIFGQFATKFFFKLDEPVIAKMISNMCGMQVTHSQKRNISFGANEFRDGQGYTEQEQKKELVEYNDIASLKAGECFLLLPLPEVRLSRITVPLLNLEDRNKEFVPQKANNIVRCSEIEIKRKNNSKEKRSTKKKRDIIKDDKDSNNIDVESMFR